MAFSDTTDATSSTAAAVKTAGGLAVAKNLCVGGDASFGVASPKSNNANSAWIQNSNSLIECFSGVTATYTLNAYRNSGGSLSYITTGIASVLYQYNGDLVYQTAASGSGDDAITFTDRFKCSNAGLVTCAAVNLGDTDLGDYKEGTWTPAVTGTTGSAGTYAASTAVGTYTRIGRVVYVKFSIVLTSKGSWTGNAQITGLPYTSSSASNTYSVAALGAYRYVTSSSTYSQVGITITPNVTSINLLESGNNASLSNLPMANIANNSELYGELFYFV
jgi:hypothetical protein